MTYHIPVDLILLSAVSLTFVVCLDLLLGVLGILIQNQLVKETLQRGMKFVMHSHKLTYVVYCKLFDHGRLAGAFGQPSWSWAIVVTWVVLLVVVVFSIRVCQILSKYFGSSLKNI